MKKILTLFVILIFSISSHVNAQDLWGVDANVDIVNAQFQNAFVETTTAANYATTTWTALSIYDTDNFNVPGAAFWTRSTTGSSLGAYNSSYILTSPSRENGSGLFDSDYLDNGGIQNNFGLGTSPSAHKGELISPRIDLSGNTDEVLSVKFYSYYRKFQITELSVSFSSDDGATWGSAVPYHNLPTNNNLVNTFITLQLPNSSTQGVSNLSQCRIKFTFTGDYYFAFVDDVTILKADTTAPTLAIQAPETTYEPYTATFQFSENVTGFEVADITVGNGTASSFSTVNAATYTALITPTSSGNVTIDVAADAALDSAGNGNEAAIQAVTNFHNITPDANNILYVNATVSGSDNSGNTWPNALTELADALLWANLNEEVSWATTPLKIYVAQGTYKPMYSPVDGSDFGTNQGRDNSFSLVNNVQLYGGFDPANGIDDLSDARISPSPGNGSILSGDVDGNDGANFANNGENNYHVVVSSGAVGMALLNGFTISGGNASGTSNVTINTNDVTQNFGGGMTNYYSAPLVTNTIFTGNWAGSGGGMRNRSSDTNITNTLFIGNSANNGGGMLNEDSYNLTIINTTFSGNSATDSGGGIFNYYTAPTLVNCIIWANTATNNGKSIHNGLGASTIISYSLIEDLDNSGNNGLNGTDPNNAPLFTNADSGDLSLQSGSPGINVGSNQAYTDAGGDLQNDVDLAGNPRLYNGTPATDIIDLGAYEFQAITPDANNILYVDINVSGGSGSGNSWTNALTDIQTAIDASTDEVKIFVKKGEYTLSATLVMKEGVEIYGSFEGTETTLAARDLSSFENDAANATILKSNGSNRVITNENNSLTSASVLDGFVITGGANTDKGGGIYNNNASPTLHNLIITGNTAQGSYSSSWNGGNGYGGGIYNIGASSPNLTNVILSGNNAKGGYGGDGGGFSYGGGMYNGDNSAPKLTNVIIKNNNSNAGESSSGDQGSSGYGGGIYNAHTSSPILTNVTLSGNQANGYDGDVFDDYGYGGGLYNEAYSEPKLYNTLVFGNTADYGAGIDNNNASTEIHYSLIQDVTNTNNGNIDATGITVADLFMDPDNGDYSLKNTNPAINAGSNQAYTDAGGDLANDVDVAGNPRVYNGSLDPNVIDIGAYELQEDYRAPIAPDANNILYVNKNASGGDGSGNSWANALSELTEALSWAEEDYTGSEVLKIWVAKGIYYPTTETTNRSASFNLLPNMEIYGGFDPANGIDDLTDARIFPDSTTEGTILSGDIDNNDALISPAPVSGNLYNNNSGNSFHVVNASTANANSLIDGVSIMQGNASGSGYNDQLGGGIYADNTIFFSISLRNSKVSNNSANYNGGAIFASSNVNGSNFHVIVTNSTLSNNSASSNGGGIYAFSKANTTVTLTNVSVINNLTASQTGGVYAYTYASSTLNFNNSVFSGNKRNSDVSNYSNTGTTTIKNSYVEGEDLSLSNGNLNGTEYTATDLFTDPANGDYSLNSNSPAVNAGDNSLYTDADGDLVNDLDLAGNPRLFGTTIDMGAYESQVVKITPDANNILYVDKDVSGSDGSGDSWPNALIELADALVWAKNNESIDWATTPLQIYVAIGTYKPMYSPTDDNFGNDAGRNNSLLMVNNVQIYGGFDPANNIVDLSDARILPTEEGIVSGSILSGEIGTPNDLSDNTYQVVISSGSVGTAILDGFSITRGYANVYTDFLINGNQVFQCSGAGVYNSVSSPDYKHILLFDNTCTESGGGMFSYQSSPSLQLVSIKNNQAKDGGGMANQFNSFTTLLNVSIQSNTASENGSGMYNVDQSSATLTNVSIVGNSATVNSEEVSGCVSDNSEVILNNSIIWDAISGDYTAQNSLIKDNDDTSNGNLDATGLVDSDIFTDPDNGDYSLKFISPAVNVGDNSLYTDADGDLVNDLDLVGNPRLFGATIDMGAFEFQGESGYIWNDNTWTPANPQGNATAQDDVFVMNGTTNFTQALEVNSITVMTGATLNVEDVLTIHGDITNNGNLIFKSTATKNGELAQVSATSTISGAITVERYMKDKRSYRMVSSAVTTSTSIHDNWQEGTTSNTDNPNAGFGTHITGSTTDQMNGFDGTATGNASMFTVNVGTQQFEAIANTDVNTLTAGSPYLLFVRGDRGIDLGDNLASSETVLRATGSLVTGANTQSFGTVILGDFAMFGNPYQSAVDINSVFANATNVNANMLYVYDPSLGDHGSYVTVNLPAGTNTSNSDVNQYLQPGQGAQFATVGYGWSSVVFNETDKAPGNFTATSRPVVASAMLTVQLYTTENFNNGGSVHDSFGIVFADGNSNSLTPTDAVKPMNFYENLGIDHNGTYLSLEQREMPQAGEVFGLYSTGYTKSDYTLKLTVDGLEASFLYLDDHFTGSIMLLEAGENSYSYNVDSNDALSIATDRFSIRTEQRLGVDDNSLLAGIRLYPNPLNGNTFYINAPKLNGERLAVSISDLTGRSIYKQTLDCRANTVTVPMGENIASGVYLVTLKHGGEAQTYRLIKE